jgi:quercetin dioxygenase-like cupin family protein
MPAAQRLPAPHAAAEAAIAASGLTWTVDGRPIDVGPGQALCIPRGAVHRFDNNGSRDAKALCVITPAAIGPEYFREAFAVLNAAAGGPPDRARMAEIMRRHGLTPAAPQT